MTQRRSDIVIGIIIIVMVVGVFWMAFSLFRAPADGDMSFSGSGDVVILAVEGMIADPEPFLNQLKQFRDRKDVKAIVIRIESPGGMVAASQEMYEAIKRAREGEKPVIASMGSIAASGGYYIALGADSIVANPGTLTGSIGVLMDFPQVTKMMNKIGIEFHSVTSGPLKNAGSPYKEWDEETRGYYKSIVMNTYEQFVEVVAFERKMDMNEARDLADGRVFTGEQAFQYGLIDRMGGLYDAVQMAARMAGIPGEPTTITPARRHIRLWDILFGDLEQVVNHFSQAPLLEYRYQ